MTTTQSQVLTKDHRLTAAMASVRDELRTRRETRAARRQLFRDLSVYTSAADLDDLYATLARYDDERSAPVREVLDRIHAHAL